VAGQAGNFFVPGLMNGLKKEIALLPLLSASV
jgi:hypothetical protein